MQVQLTEDQFDDYLTTLAEFVNEHLKVDEIVIDAAKKAAAEIAFLREELAMARAQKVGPTSTAVDALAKEVIDLFNRVNDKTYRYQTYKDNIRVILKANPRLTLDHFAAVIQHKKEKWGSDEKMAEYNRPATLFQSPKKFLVYVDDAVEYFREKDKSVLKSFI